MEIYDEMIKNLAISNRSNRRFMSTQKMKNSNYQKTEMFESMKNLHFNNEPLMRNTKFEESKNGSLKNYESDFERQTLPHFDINASICSLDIHQEASDFKIRNIPKRMTMS